MGFAVAFVGHAVVSAVQDLVAVVLVIAGKAVDAEREEDGGERTKLEHFGRCVKNSWLKLKLACQREEMPSISCVT